MAPSMAPRSADKMIEKSRLSGLTWGDRSGAEGIRTPDPLHAMQVRYQLRHSPGNAASLAGARRVTEDHGRSAGVVAGLLLRRTPGVVLLQTPAAAVVAHHRPPAVAEGSEPPPRIRRHVEQGADRRAGGATVRYRHEQCAVA